MVSTFKIGTEVLSNHGQAKIERIEVVEPGQKEDGISVNESVSYTHLRAHET